MEKNNNAIKTLGTLAIIGFFVFALVYVGVFVLGKGGKTQKEITRENAMGILEKMNKEVSPISVEPRKVPVTLEVKDMKETLPDIEKYPLQVEASTESFIEIFSSPEKAGEKKDGWLLEVANDFNKAGIQVDGKPVSVSVRNLASGMAVDYIQSGKYLPDAFTPSNELWGEMLKSQGVNTTLEEPRLAGNIAGILLSKTKEKEIKEKYGSINLKAVTQAVAANELQMGYTNPFASSTGLNFLVSTLVVFDKKDPLSDQAISEFAAFQANIPFVSYTTIQMRESAQSGILDGFIMEYQTYANSPELKNDYVFTPFGERHDNPMYAIGELSNSKKEILQQFVDFCKSEKYQKKAKEYGFNQLDNYKSQVGTFQGDKILQAQKLWKEKKDGNNDIIAVFVADTSGSMAGEPINKLKESLLNGAQFIGNDHSVGLVTFDSDVKINLPIGKFDLNQRSLFAGAVTDMKANGGTAMYDGIVVATKMLMEEKQRNPNAKLMLFVLGDGDPNIGYKLKDTEKMIQALKVPIYTIGYNANIGQLEKVSSINEAASINADTDDVIYKLQNLFNAQM